MSNSYRARRRSWSPSAWPDERYARIAAAYVARVEAGSRHAGADVASASRGTLSAAQVRDAIHTARGRGLLTPTTKQGRPGGQLTPRAEALLRARQPDLVSYDDWRRLDALEVSNGKGCGRPRLKFTTVEEMLAALGRS